MENRGKKNEAQRRKLADVVALGSYEEVENLDLETLTHNEADRGAKLSGLIIRGYETRFADGTNTNGERYTKECLDGFFAEYYKKRGLNMPLTLMHGQRVEDLAGRVLTIEINSVGFYFVCYIARSLPNYAQIRALIKEGVLQGLSKEGWATRGKVMRDKNGEFLYYLVEEMEMLAVSLVTTPANGNNLERVQEVKNALQIIKTEESKPRRKTLADMFSK